jgi:hypothetical protein
MLATRRVYKVEHSSLLRQNDLFAAVVQWLEESIPDRLAEPDAVTSIAVPFKPQACFDSSHSSRRPSHNWTEGGCVQTIGVRKIDDRSSRPRDRDLVSNVDLVLVSRMCHFKLKTELRRAE